MKISATHYSKITALALFLCCLSNLTIAGTIGFDLDRLNAEGLQGQAKGLRALHYEYCVPNSAAAIQTISAIDPTLQIQGSSPGRIGCASYQLLCLGNTHQPNHRAILKQLAALPFVSRIEENFFE